MKLQDIVIASVTATALTACGGVYESLTEKEAREAASDNNHYYEVSRYIEMDFSKNVTRSCKTHTKKITRPYGGGINSYQAKFSKNEAQPNIGVENCEEYQNDNFHSDWYKYGSVIRLNESVFKFKSSEFFERRRHKDRAKRALEENIIWDVALFGLHLDFKYAVLTSQKQSADISREITPSTSTEKSTGWISPLYGSTFTSGTTTVTETPGAVEEWGTLHRTEQVRFYKTRPSTGDYFNLRHVAESLAPKRGYRFIW